MSQYHCHVCGVGLEDAPWGTEGLYPTYDICPCCGCEYGYEDFTAAGVLAHRQKWLAGGAVWFHAKDRPAGWQAEEQLKQVPAKLPPGIKSNT